MSVNSTGRGCRRRAHQGDAAHRMAIYDSLPREIRDELKIARNNLCAGCIRNELRWRGLERVLDSLDLERRYVHEKRGSEAWLVPEEDLRP